MKVLVLGGGYGTRLVRDITNDSTGLYHHLLNVPKALLPICDRPLLSHWLKLFQSVDDVDHIYIETNDVFYEKFEEWSKGWAGFVSVVNDKTSSNETRLGAVAAIQYLSDHFNVNEDVIVVAGDTLFYKDFNLRVVIDQFKKRKSNEKSCSLVMVYDCDDTVVSKHGILEVDEDQRVVSFLEKPDPNSTTSRLACPCFYFLSSSALKEVSTYLELHKDAPLSKKDATGNFLNYLYKRLPVYAFKISGRFDVGGLSSYKECLKYFS